MTAEKTQALKKVAAMQPYFFPYLGYFQLISAVDTFVIGDNFNYIKSGWVNRNRLLTVEGEPFYFTVPVRPNSSHVRIRDIEIAHDWWRKKFVKSLVMNYRTCPYFDEAFPLLEKLVANPTDSLSRLNTNCLVGIAEYLGIDAGIRDDFDWDGLEDRLPDSKIELLNPVPKVKRAIALCQTFQAATFVNPIGGREIYPADEFRRNKVEIEFLSMNAISYPQNSRRYRQKGDFCSHLSIIDTLMNCGREGTIALLNQFVLE